MTPKNDRNLSVLFCWSLGPDQPGVPSRVGMRSCLVRMSHFSRPFNDVEYPLSLKISHVSPLESILLFTVYKHLNNFMAKLLVLAAVIRNIQQRRHLYLWSCPPPSTIFLFLFFCPQVHRQDLDC